MLAGQFLHCNSPIAQLGSAERRDPRGSRDGLLPWGWQMLARRCETEGGLVVMVDGDPERLGLSRVGFPLPEGAVSKMS